MNDHGPENSLYIGGRWLAPSSDARIDVISPFTEQQIASVSAASLADVDKAVAAARRAFDDGPWPRMSVEERSAVLIRLREILVRRRDELAQVITDEMGSPITASKAQQAQIPVMRLTSFIEIAREIEMTELRESSSGSSLVIRHPKGVVAAIVPWNAPIMTLMMKLAPALLMGCSLIAKTSPETALSGNLLAEMLHEAGLPEGVVSILPADRETSEYLALHPGVDKVTFTGSTLAGRHLATRCGAVLRPITLELGGKSAAVILDDADIPAAIEALRVGSFRNSGQICSLKTRVLVSSRRKDEVIDALAAMVHSMPLGDPNDPETQIGPMVSKRQMDRITQYIDRGIADGATLVTGGSGRPKGLNHGWFIQPTVFADVDPNAVIAQEEIFGPVVAISTFEDEAEAEAIANNSVYGLSGAVFSKDIDRAVNLARRIKTGGVEINGAGVGFHSPVGGFKESGIGREGGAEGFEPYVDYQAIGIPKAYAHAFVSKG